MRNRFLTDEDQLQLVQTNPQTLTAQQQTQARQNIGAAAPGDIPADTLRYSAQSLTTQQKTQARQNIGAAAPGDIPADTLRYSAQTLTAQQQEQVQANIRAVGRPASAAVGQTIVVLEVDEQGVPCRWEAVDYPTQETWVFTLEDDSTVTRKVAVFP